MPGPPTTLASSTQRCCRPGSLNIHGPANPPYSDPFSAVRPNPHLRDSTNTIIIKRWNIHLRSVFQSHQYHQWLCRQFNWNSAILNEIDFDGLDMAIRCLPTHLHRFVVKWINQNIPVRRRVHRYDRHIPPTCRLCPATVECDDHLMQCPSDLRRAACADTYSSLQERLTQLHTHPGIQTTVLHLLAQALAIPSCAPPTLPLNAITQQNLLGPARFLKGQWSRVFRQTQEQFYRAQHRPPSFTRDRWIRQTLSLLFEKLHHIWQCRNKQSHGADQTIQDQLKREKLSIRVQALYNHQPNLLAHDRDILDSMSQNDLLSGPLPSIETWLRMAEPTKQQCLKEAHAKSTTNQRDIRDYFDEASYVDSDADETTLSYDTLGSSGTILFSNSNHTTSSHDTTIISSSTSTGTLYLGSDGSP